MNRILTGIVASFLLVAFVGVPMASANPGSSMQGSWIVTLKSGHDPSTEARRLARAYGGEVRHIYKHVLNGFNFLGSDQAAASLARNPKVRSVVADQAVQAIEETLPTGVQRIDGHDALGAGKTGSGIRIAILDTGIDLDHEDLVVNQSLGKNCIDPSKPPDDGHGHGTHVAGIAAAVAGNNKGVIGVGAGAEVVPVKVLDDGGSGTWSSVICGVDHITGLVTDGSSTNDVHAANMSLGGSGQATGCTDGGLHQAICESVAAGVTYSVAAGNDKKDASGTVPAAYPEVITVSALADFDGEPGGLAGCFLYIGLGWQCDDDFAKFSNHGSIVDVIAPGMEIYSTDKNNTYSWKSGTSMAAPHVAGVVALVKAQYPGASPASIEAHLKQTGECPNGSFASDDGNADCNGQGQWDNDPDGIPEPLVNALRAASTAPGGGGSANTAPAAVDKGVSTYEDTGLAITLEGSDAETCELTFSIVSGPSHGSLSGITNNLCSGSGPYTDTAGVTYTPNADYNGPDAFTYRVSDGSASDDATVSITVNPVNDPPVAADKSVSTAKDTQVAIDLAGSDADGCVGQTFTFNVTIAPANGTLSATSGGMSCASGALSASVTYTPSAGYTGSDSFKFTISDGTATSNEATVSITVSEQSTVMHVADLDGWSTNQGKTWTANVTITVHDGNHALVTGFTVTGAFTYNGSAVGVECTDANSDGTCAVSLSGIAKRTGSVTFAVSSVQRSGMTYDSTANHDPDGDSNGTSITVVKPA